MTSKTSSKNIVDNLNSAPMVPRIKTVEGQLWMTLKNLAATEAKVHLFSTLRLMGLGTNDVENFVEKQSIHKKVKTWADNRVRGVAMQSKL